MAFFAPSPSLLVAFLAIFGAPSTRAFVVRQGDAPTTTTDHLASSISSPTCTTISGAEWCRKEQPSVMRLPVGGGTDETYSSSSSSSSYRRESLVVLSTAAAAAAQSSSAGVDSWNATSAPTPSPSASTPYYRASVDGVCASNNRTCAGSRFGACCSQRGYCGDSAAHCALEAAGCQRQWGECWDDENEDAEDARPVYLTAAMAEASVVVLPKMTTATTTAG